MDSKYNFSSNSIEYITTTYEYLMSLKDVRTDGWPLTESPFIPGSFVLTYFFIVWVGPKFMANRKPIDPGHLLTLYNFLLVGLSSYMVYEFFMSAYLASYSLGCQPIDYSNDPLALRMARVCWVYYVSKYIEAFDTIFFILRKKNNQITFLHVYHHGTMIFVWWVAVRFVAGGVAYFHAMLNSGVHVVMYSYYGLSACGSAIQPFLWWKKYVTKLQMMQFFIVFVQAIYVTTMCDFPRVLSIPSVFYVISMIVLFSNFYYQEYHRRANRRAQQQEKKSTSNETNGLPETEQQMGLQEGLHKRNVNGNQI